MILEYGRRALRLFHRRQRDAALLLGLLNAPFDVPDGRRILLNL